MFTLKANIARKRSNESRFGPGRTGQIFVYFAKKSVRSCLRQVRPVIFRSTKFCQSLPNFKDAVVVNLEPYDYRTIFFTYS